MSSKRLRSPSGVHLKVRETHWLLGPQAIAEASFFVQSGMGAGSGECGYHFFRGFFAVAGACCLTDIVHPKVSLRVPTPRFLVLCVLTKS